MMKKRAEKSILESQQRKKRGCHRTWAQPEQNIICSCSTRKLSVSRFVLTSHCEFQSRFKIMKLYLPYSVHFSNPKELNGFPFIGHQTKVNDWLEWMDICKTKGSETRDWVIHDYHTNAQNLSLFGNHNAVPKNHCMIKWPWKNL